MECLALAATENYPVTMRLTILALAALFIGSAAARAEIHADCEACRSEDEVQVGAYAPPDISDVTKPVLPDPRGREISVPIPGVPTIRHRAGAGVYVGELGEGNNVFVKPGRDKVSIGMRRDF
jgi:hypothetical protein